MIQHQMLLVGPYVDALTGEEWELLECPTCGYMQKVQWEPHKSETLRYGEGMLAPGGVEEITALCKSGPVGRLKASQILARQPSHAYVRVPTEGELREAARLEDVLDEFEESVDQAIIEGRPLIEFGMGGAKASTWPKGTGPVK